ncbi:MAG: hypothetical protein A3C53_08300 [Omnitrophica WOR_2 bacterium RIFCSPHIGHO2_02_FULL_68_15]|nr:MAG: hypothetical protein A3C53_08300 [Omnitrophica WOR_2 bacterium RIFCSPHIGHO2_02_FULL_68_15]
MRVLLDENIPRRVGEWINQRGHEAARVPAGLKNGAVIELARREARVLVTRDQDFADRFHYPPAQSPGLIVLRVHPPTQDRLIAALQRLLSERPEVRFSGHLIVVEEQGYHVIV